MLLTKYKEITDQKELTFDGINEYQFLAFANNLTTISSLTDLFFGQMSIETSAYDNVLFIFPKTAEVATYLAELLDRIISNKDYDPKTNSFFCVIKVDSLKSEVKANIFLIRENDKIDVEEEWLHQFKKMKQYLQLSNTKENFLLLSKSEILRIVRKLFDVVVTGLL
jgi:hypothetical protein